MLHYLYLDYGGLPKYRRELKYSLISLRSELAGTDAAIAVYTDAPQAYRGWPVTAVDIASQVAPWSGGGLYHHRIKPVVVKDALCRFAGPVCFPGFSDSIIRPGFHAEVTAKLAAKESVSSVVMNSFRKNRTPYPPLSGFRCTPPASGRLSLRCRAAA